MSERFKFVKSEEQKCEMPSDEAPHVVSEWCPTGFLWNGQPFTPAIGKELFCNVEKIELDGSYTASLDFSAALKRAQSALERGKKLYWQIDLELFGDPALLSQNAGRHASRLLALDHFLETCYNRYRNSTFGISLYQGPADFRKSFGQESADLSALFSLRDLAADYLSLLAGALPDELLVFLAFDKGSLKESELLQALNLELFERFLLAVKGSASYFYALSWQHGAASYGGLDLPTFPDKIATTTGFLLPGKDFITESNLAALEKALCTLKASDGAYRLLPESRMTAYWDELDKLVAIDGSLSFSGQRQLQGFLAAGGQSVLLPFLN